MAATHWCRRWRNPSGLFMTLVNTSPYIALAGATHSFGSVHRRQRAWSAEPIDFRPSRPAALITVVGF
jgi:hypothetical protein